MYGYNSRQRERSEEGKIASDLKQYVNEQLAIFNDGHVSSAGHERSDVGDRDDDHDYFYMEGRSMPRDFRTHNLPEWAEWSHSHDGGPCDHREVVVVDRDSWRDWKETTDD